MNKVLILLSTYNGDKYLQQQLDSLYNQQEVEVEILVRDDCSNDKTIEILNKNNINYYTGSFLDVSHSYFDLMKQASKYNCDYFAFCDQDDVWDKDKLKIAISSIQNTKEPALYYSGQRIVDENLTFIENHILNKKRSLKTRFVLSDFAGCTGVFNKSLLKEVIKYEPKYMLMHDTWILRVCLSIGGKVIIDPYPHISYRQHSNNTIGLKHDLISTYNQVNNYINKYKIEEVSKELLNGYGDRIIEPYKEVLQHIANYKKNRISKSYLLNKENIDFCNFGLNLTYKIKVLINKL